MHPTVSRPGDFVENCLEALAEKPRRPPREKGYYYLHKHEDKIEEGMDVYHNLPYSIRTDGERDETTTIVGTRLHGPYVR